MQFESVDELFSLLRKEDPELKSLDEVFSDLKKEKPEIESIEDLLSFIKEANPQEESITIDDVVDLLRDEALNIQISKGLLSVYRGIEGLKSKRESLVGGLEASRALKAPDDEIDLQRLSGVGDVLKKENGKA